MKNKKIKLWQWIISVIITAVSGITVWTNESVDLLSKFGFIVEPGVAFIIFGLSFIIGLSWLMAIIMKRGNYI